MTPEVSAEPRAKRARGVRKDDVKKFVEGAIAGGLPIRGVEMDLKNLRITILAVDDSAPSSDAADLERRMEEAFRE